jgi:hypothetical protein
MRRRTAMLDKLISTVEVLGLGSALYLSITNYVLLLSAETSNMVALHGAAGLGMLAVTVFILRYRADRLVATARSEAEREAQAHLARLWKEYEQR